MAKTPPKHREGRHPGGRPSDYNEEIADKICAMMIGDNNENRPWSLNKVIQFLDGKPAMGTVMRWLADHDKFQEQYARASELAGLIRAEKNLDIADEKPMATVTREFKDGTSETRKYMDMVGIQRNKLRVETNQWYASVCAPRKYGKKAELGDQIINLAEELKLARARSGVKA